jgi:hypothetical protein
MFWVEYALDNYTYIDAQSLAIMSIEKAQDNNEIIISFRIRTLDFGIKRGRQFKEQFAHQKQNECL